MTDGNSKPHETPPAPTGTWEERRYWEAQLAAFKQRLESGYPPEVDENLARAKDLVAAGLLYRVLGYTEEWLRHVEAAQQLAPDEPSLATHFNTLKIHNTPESDTPWDTDIAVAPYDDVEQLKSLAGLPFKDFFQQSSRGGNRRRMCEVIIGMAPPDGRILEAGCAAGGFYASLNPFIDTSRYVAVDLTPSMARRAKHHFPNLDVLRMDVRSLAFADNSFPLTFSTDVLMHLENWQCGLRELYRVTSHRLLLRIRIHSLQEMPTMTARVGARSQCYPYVIHNFENFLEAVEELNPEKIAIETPERERMYIHLWQIAVEHPEIMAGIEKQRIPSINGALDLLITKQKP